MLVLLVVVLTLSAWTLSRLGSGTNVDLSRVAAQALQLDQGRNQGPEEQLTERSRDDVIAPPAGPAVTGQPTAAPQATAAPVPGEKRFTLTAAGVCALEPDLRRSGYSNDSKKYDFTDMMLLLKPSVSGDIRAIFMENILNDDWKVSTTVVPTCMADMLQAAGFNLALCGYASSWEKKADGVASTRAALEARGIRPLGIYDTEEQAVPQVTDVNGIPTAFLQYTGMMNSGTRGVLRKNGLLWAVPEAEIGQITGDIQTARNAGAKAVIVFLNWGKIGGKTPERAQRVLAQQVADAGATLIIGSGSRSPQTAEYLTSGNCRVLCVYSMGTVMSDKRTSALRMAGYLFHVTVVQRADGNIEAEAPEYTPIYTWKYRQDGKDYFRCVRAAEAPPDGMDADQTRTMGKALDITTQTLADSPLTLRGGTQ